jgi:hypothetical protein
MSFASRKDPVEQQDVERIARATLKELGLPKPDLMIMPVEGQPGQWQIDIRGNRNGPGSLRIRCGKGSTPQWVREQIFNQYTA